MPHALVALSSSPSSCVPKRTKPEHQLQSSIISTEWSLGDVCTISSCFVAFAAHIILHDVHHYDTQLKSISLPLTKNNNITAIYRSISDIRGKTLVYTRQLVLLCVLIRAVVHAGTHCQCTSTHYEYSYVMRVRVCTSIVLCCTMNSIRCGMIYLDFLNNFQEHTRILVALFLQLPSQSPIAQ